MIAVTHAAQQQTLPAFCAPFPADNAANTSNTKGMDTLSSPQQADISLEKIPATMDSNINCPIRSSFPKSDEP
jgi:hypothetical protein